MIIEYPTKMHERAAEQITAFFSNFENVQAVLLTCSCARGKATKDSCLDIAILLPAELCLESRTKIVNSWNKEHSENKLYKDLRDVGKYSHIDLEFIDGTFKEGYHSWTSGPDEYELEIGNFIAYSKQLYTSSNYYDQLKSTWLPYYNDQQRQRRLKMVKEFCLNNLHHIPLYVERGLYFQSFNRLYNAMREFLQALFIAKRIYPIAYDKWIKEQLCDMLKMPDLYSELVQLMEYGKFESSEHNSKAKKLENFVDQLCGE
jgi:predicted nucleotidyltransferase